MRILVITEEDEFYLPGSIGHLIENCPEEIVGVVCARNPLLPSKLDAGRKFCAAFGPGPVLLQGLRVTAAKVLDGLSWLNLTGRFYSVKRLCKARNMRYSHVDNINSADFIRDCRELDIDLIASVSPTQIFKSELISLPRHGCINIHTAKLPEYRGLYPMYWAMACGQRTVGISIHYIEDGIDTGKIILQDELEIPPKTTLNHMLRVTKLRGVELLIDAIRQIGSGTSRACYAEGEGSYFSFPTAESYRQFKRLGYKLW